MNEGLSQSEEDGRPPPRKLAKESCHKNVFSFLLLSEFLSYCYEVIRGIAGEFKRDF